MSFNFDDFNYDYGHWHGDAGIPFSVFTGDASIEDIYGDDGQSLYQQELILKAAKVFAHLDSKRAILSALARELLKVGKPYAIRRYGRLEGLTVESQELSLNENCLRYLAIHFFSEHAVILDTKILQIIDKAVLDVKSISSDIAYDKIRQFQEFLHSEIVRHKGVGADLRLDREQMQTILSTARLHLSCEEVKVNNLEGLTALSSRYALRIAAEKKSNSESRYGSNIKNWKLRHIKPLVWYYGISVRESLRMLVSQKLGAGAVSVTSLKDQCTNLLADVYEEAL